ncbi:hypothetical protein CSB11_00385 [Candidatus Campbellbacteria bacterium]|nr:MAG: hypothetical protein CSB11_00385 [Candidatus Campbellbacteria bacterium]
MKKPKILFFIFFILLQLYLIYFAFRYESIEKYITNYYLNKNEKIQYQISNINCTRTKCFVNLKNTQNQKNRNITVLLFPFPEVWRDTKYLP